ncbi:Dabb family protein [Larkinella arboricola]|uniref:Stress responsive alpha/beta barrel protein n=1 Tax=Larkinella arboricola TaxID=643671 RepID=A0A327WZV8_LARAB|nr:Dabb family protein [Larkinella arboricola]RAJ97895.1 stress responsive alpha/beta barrel protein [Larkinella arboricola]
MFVHTVFFWLTNPGSDEDRQALRAGLETLKGITHFEALYIGKPADTRRPVIDHSYDWSLTYVFRDKAAHDAYQVDPIHEKFVENCSRYWQRVQVYDAVE